MGTDAKSDDIVGSGPFMLGSYVRGEKITLKRNPNYWKKDSAGNKLPYLDEVVTLIVRDGNAMLLNFERKVSDYFPLRSGKDVAASLSPAIAGDERRVRSKRFPVRSMRSENVALLTVTVPPSVGALILPRMARSGDRMSSWRTN